MTGDVSSKMCEPPVDVMSDSHADQRCEHDEATTRDAAAVACRSPKLGGTTSHRAAGDDPGSPLPRWLASRPHGPAFSGGRGRRGRTGRGGRASSKSTSGRRAAGTGRGQRLDAHRASGRNGTGGEHHGPFNIRNLNFSLVSGAAVEAVQVDQLQVGAGGRGGGKFGGESVPGEQEKAGRGGGHRGRQQGADVLQALELVEADR